MRVVVDGKDVTLTQKDVLGSGGEGTVFKVQLGTEKLALKVYEKPTAGRAQKLESFRRLSPSFPRQVAAPKSLARNAKGLVVGFTMPLLSSGFEDLAKLANRKFRASYGINTKGVAELFLDGIPTLATVHKQGFVVGDLNDLNVLFQSKNMLWIDVDSWQFGSYPCTVATETFLDPLLYGLDLARTPSFTPGNDWYSFAAMLFRSLLFVHPFGGVHKDFKRLVERAKRRISVFDPLVVYPKVAISPDILTDDLANLFTMYFTRDFREAFPESLLRDYLSALRKCSSCGIEFPATRGSCPVCSARMVVVITRPVASGKKITVDELVRTQGQILLARVVGDEVKAIADIRGKLILYSKKPGFPVTTQELGENEPGMRFEIGQDHITANPRDTHELGIYDISGEPRLIQRLTSEIFAGNRRACFRLSDKYLFRIAGSMLVYGEFKNGQVLERPLRRVMENQTWFWADSSAATPYVFGLFQVLRQQSYWMIKEGGSYDVAIPQLEATETLLDISVRFSNQGVYLFRKTQFAGVDYLRQELVDASGKVIFSNRQEVSGHPAGSAHGHAYATGIALHPTDDGILQEELMTGGFKTFTETKGYVDGGDTLLRYGNGVLVVKIDRVSELKLA